LVEDGNQSSVFQMADYHSASSHRENALLMNGYEDIEKYVKTDTVIRNDQENQAANAKPAEHGDLYFFLG
jgi:hypothetical protein